MIKAVKKKDIAAGWIMIKAATMSHARQGEQRVLLVPGPHQSVKARGGSTCLVQV